MRILDAVTQVRAIKPNPYPDEVLVRWLGEADGLIWEEFLCKMRGGGVQPMLPYEATQYGMEQELLVPDPYSGIYSHYLAAQIDYHNGDIDRYNNAMVRYNNALSAYTDHVMRTDTVRATAVVRL